MSNPAFMWLPKDGNVFADTPAELINLAARSSFESMEDWEPVAIIGTGAYDKGGLHVLAAKLEGTWHYYNELQGPFSVRVRGKVKFARKTREVIADDYYQDELPF